jgi:hypothetical protein
MNAVLGNPDMMDGASLPAILDMFASPIAFMEPERCTSRPWLGHISVHGACGKR